MSGDRQELDIPDLGNLDDFETPAPHRVPGPSSDRKKQEIAKATSFPSREAPDEGQLNMKGRNAVLYRFKDLCKDDRRKYVDMLEILMDVYEQKQGPSPVR